MNVKKPIKLNEIPEIKGLEKPKGNGYIHPRGACVPLTYFYYTAGSGDVTNPDQINYDWVGGISVCGYTCSIGELLEEFPDFKDDFIKTYRYIEYNSNSIPFQKPAQVLSSGWNVYAPPPPTIHAPNESIEAYAYWGQQKTYEIYNYLQKYLQATHHWTDSNTLV